jgi:hypothetical protein
VFQISFPLTVLRERNALLDKKWNLKHPPPVRLPESRPKSVKNDGLGVVNLP